MRTKKKEKKEAFKKTQEKNPAITKSSSHQVIK